MANSKKASTQTIDAKSAAQPNKCSLQIRVFDGTRNPFPDGKDVLYRVIDANQKQIVQVERPVSALNCQFDFHDNFMDRYTVIAFSDDHKQAGFTPVSLSPVTDTVLDLMLIPKDGHPNFADATWDWVTVNLPFLAKDVSNAVGKTRYEDLLENKPLSLASLLHITTAMKQIHLPVGSPLDYLHQ